MTALVMLAHGLALLVGALLVALGLVGAAWWHRRAEARELAARAEAAEAEYTAVVGRQTKLFRELDALAEQHADAVRELGHERARRAAADQRITDDVDLPSRQSLEREQERWGDLINGRSRSLTDDEAAWLASLQNDLREL